MKNNKKIISAVLACTMIAGMSLASFAAAGDPSAPSDVSAGSEVTTIDSSGVTVENEGTTTAPTFKAMIPAASAFVLNPYKVGGAKQVLAPKMSFENLTKAPINIYVKSAVPTVATDSGIKMASAATTATTTDKQIFMFLRPEIEGSLVDYDPVGDATTKYKAATATVAGDVLVKTGGSQVLLATLKASADGTTAAADGGTVKAQFMGDMAPAPLLEWKTTDTLKVTTIYTFKVLSAAE